MRKFLLISALTLAGLSTAISADSPSLSPTVGLPLNHPGILVDTALLNFVKARLDTQPWKDAFAQAKDSKWAAEDYQATPFATVECGSGSTNPRVGCFEEMDDAAATYTQALLWSYTGNPQYAANVRSILLAWATTLTGGHQASNGPLQAAWTAALFTRGLEIVDEGYTGWLPDERAQVKKMLTEQHLPTIKQMFISGSLCHNKNWHATAIEAMANIGIVTDDRGLFDEAIRRWHQLVPAYIYDEQGDNRPPNAPWCRLDDDRIKAHWHFPKHYVKGLSQETCRDLAHTSMGLAAIINVAETARLQGVDLYSKEQQRIVAALELHSAQMNGNIPQPLCEGPILENISGTFEIAYNHYALRKGVNLPETQTFLAKKRPQVGAFHLRWETLTHGLTGSLQGNR
ncbi:MULTISPECIES: alginate lyase family protein [unclassified Pseudomonas]|jgi:hypothetical protein|uniref:alginate lyase family protein n=1 Tax=unclassified Pseudomonas TaxID=196821 RepID=UPI000A0EC66D|nr:MULTISPECIES: alginate lyase family protein [unclassified Pseudomonas]SMF03715.1 Alginate lyase [Pseudomonas sp. LAIL14HWK12:I11]SMR72516.1 Alginate lyase [Pseudomonas sp. LAIL14HWK12:I10]SOD01419.1 Alginate lyase [Pseudomonas sp. LAIL14HWK12:I8]